MPNSPMIKAALGTPASGDIGVADIARMKGMLGCNPAAPTDYCAALDGFLRGNIPMGLAAPRALIGRTMKAFESPTRIRSEELGYLVLGAAGASFGEVTPDNAQEAQQAQEAIALMRAGQAVPPTHPLNVFVQSLATRQLNRYTVTGNSLRFQQANQVFLRQEGARYLVIERSPSSTGFYIAIFQ